MKKLNYLFLLFISLGRFVIPVSAETIDKYEKTEINQQTKRITGVVVDVSKEPLIGVNIAIKGTNKGATTDVNGAFSLVVPAGSELLVSYIGYKSVTVPVGSHSELSIVLEETSNSLNEVEITAEFGMKRVARAVGSSTQNIKAKDIAESGRDNFISALEGRVSGMSVTQSSGAPGASTTVVLRSVTSISGSNQPLYVVDGIPINNSTFDPTSFADAGQSLSANTLDYSSRGNDFNPEDIESMTVLKGAAAAALYGSDASNGAIIITTKKGAAGKSRITYSNSFRFDKAYGYPDIQTKYAQGAYGTTNYYYTNRYGGLYPEGMKLYDNIDAVLQTGTTMKHNIAVEAGSEKNTVRAAASFLEQEGVVKTTDYSRMNLTLSGKAEITKWMKFEASMQYSTTDNSKVRKGTSGPLYLAMQWPMVDNMLNYLDEDGTHMRLPDYYTDTDLLNPLFGLYKNKYYDEADQFISNAAVIINPSKHTFLRAQIGWDVGLSTYETGIHPYYSNNNAGAGSYNIAKLNFADKTVNVLGGYNNSFFKDKLSVVAQIGYHQQENGSSQLSSYGTNYSVVDMHSINNVDPLTVSSKKSTRKRRIQAISTQIELGYDEMLYLTLRARNDWSSTLPKNNNSYFYPAVEASYIATELPMLKDNKIVNYLKLRGSVAQVGKDAQPLAIDPQLQATGLTGGGYQYGWTGPNKDLRPEKNTSWEIGAEGRFWDDRIVSDFTYFHTHCADQIVNGFRLSYATGFVLNNMNVGTFNTWGWEGHMDMDVIRLNNGFRWNVGINLSHADSKVVKLPENVSEYYDAYTWLSGNIRNGIKVGNSITTLTGLAYSRNEKGDILISPTTGLPLVDDTWSVLGDREPKLRYGITTSLAYSGFRLSAMFSGRYKATVVNGTKRTMMTRGTSWESVSLRESDPVVFKGVLKDGNENTANPTPNNIVVTYDTYGTSIYGGNDEDWIEKNVNYLCLQELRLSYTVPTKYLKGLFNGFIGNANVYVTGNDLGVWTNYSGIDAVGNGASAALGGTGAVGFDVWSIPNPRSFAFGISLTFN